MAGTMAPNMITAQIEVPSYLCYYGYTIFDRVRSSELYKLGGLPATLLGPAQWARVHRLGVCTQLVEGAAMRFKPAMSAQTGVCHWFYRVGVPYRDGVVWSLKERLIVSNTFPAKLNV